MLQTVSPSQASAERLSLVKGLLHLEGLVVFIAAIALYWHFTDGSAWLFLAVLFVPDVAMLPYLVNERWGAVGYNIVHMYTLPIALAVTALLLGWTGVLPFALIWLAHIGMDRAVGYGLKYPTAFKETHLGRV